MGVEDGLNIIHGVMRQFKALSGVLLNLPHAHKKDIH